MVNQEDWRLRGQEEYLQNATLYFCDFTPFSETWEHEHCEFCWAKFGPESENLHNGYRTVPTNQKKSVWICPKYYADLKENFNWSIGEK